VYSIQNPCRLPSQFIALTNAAVLFFLLTPYSPLQPNIPNFIILLNEHRPALYCTPRLPSVSRTCLFFVASCASLYRWCETTVPRKRDSPSILLSDHYVYFAFYFSCLFLLALLYRSFIHSLYIACRARSHVLIYLSSIIYAPNIICVLLVPHSLTFVCCAYE